MSCDIKDHTMWLICDCPCENFYKRRVNAFKQLRTKEKMQVCLKRTNPVFTCAHVHTLVHLPAFTGEWTVFISNAVLSTFISNAVVHSKGMQYRLTFQLKTPKQMNKWKLWSKLNCYSHKHLRLVIDNLKFCFSKSVFQPAEFMNINSSEFCVWVLFTEE